MNHRVQNALEQDEHGVWRLSSGGEIEYSDGRAAERHLARAFRAVGDLGSDSLELGRWIRDWPSRYHLSAERADLLRGFVFDRDASVLEVGCGCGAITRFLGETFRDVVAVEGSLERARLARLRTCHQENVSVVCAPFQELVFRERFDVVFCVGVLEYAGSYVRAEDPYDAVLRQLRGVLNDGGVLVLAIENQFGLKYFASSREDHTGVMFDGIEGYPRYPGRARTFGYDELRRRLEAHFGAVEFYFPYPDYKLPRCVLAEPFFERVDAGELVGGFRSQDRGEARRALFEEDLALQELGRNRRLAFFANSFLVVAGDRRPFSVRLPFLGVTYSRSGAMSTVTRFVEREDGRVWVEKEPRSGEPEVVVGRLSLRATSWAWVEGISLNTELKRHARRRDVALEEILAPCGPWFSKLESLARTEGGRRVVDGSLVDAIWRNAYLQGDDCVFIDQEWCWEDSLPLNALLLRSVYWFLEDVAGRRDVHPTLRRASLRRVTECLARTLGTRVTKADYEAFFELEAEFARVVAAAPPARTRAVLRLRLASRPVYTLVSRLWRSVRSVVPRLWRLLQFS